MKWPLRSSERPASERQEDKGDLTVAQTSLALNTLIHRLKSKPRDYRFLDLGPASGQKLEFLSQYACKIHFEDLYRTLNSFDYLSPEDGVSYDSVFRYLLPYNRTIRFDVVFCWDVLNYLNPEEFRHLMRHVTRYCNGGALLFALISTQKTIPEQPAKFEIAGPETLSCRIRARIMRKCPQYQETDLARFMPNFNVMNSFLLRNGFKEYLFAYDRHRGRR